MQYEYIWDALGPDRCRFDRCAPCTYWHTKKQALNGGRDKLSAEELEFVGVETRATVSPVSDGWHQPNTLPANDPSTAMLRALMDVGDPGQERMRFLG